MRRETITVCIPTLNRPTELNVALASVLGQKYKPDAVIVMMDSAADDDLYLDGDCGQMYGNLVSALKANGISFTQAKSARPTGIGNTKNAYLDLVTTDWFLQLEDDAWLSCRYIEELMFSSAPFVGGLAGIQLLPALPHSIGWTEHDLTPQENMPDVVNELLVTKDAVTFKNKAQVFRYKTNAMISTAMCFLHTYMLRTEAVREVGGWDPRFTTAFEEVDVTYALYLAGWSLYCDPHAEMWHFRSQNRGLAWRSDPRENNRVYREAEALFISKYLGATRAAKKVLSL